jgi:hypothetical protein
MTKTKKNTNINRFLDIEEETNSSEKNIVKNKNKNKNDINETEKDVLKKRGRPKKINLNVTKYINEKKIKNNDIIKENIVLHLPIYDEDDNNNDNDDSSSEKNLFTIKDDTDTIICSEDRLNYNKNTIEQTSTVDFDFLNKKSNETILSISDDNYSDDNKYKKKHNKTIQNLMKENNKLHDIIQEMKELKDNIIHNNIATKDSKTSLVDLKIIDIKNNQTILVDKTDVLCWWDHNNFNTMPCFIPERYSNGTYYVFGCFCSMNCALAYNNKKLNDYRSITRKSLLINLCEKIYGIKEEIVEAYEVEETLKKYGLGTLTIEEFRNKNLILKKEIKSIIPPLIPMLYKTEELTRDIISIPAKVSTFNSNFKKK